MCAQVAFGIRAVGAQQESAAAAQCQCSQHLTNGKSCSMYYVDLNTVLL
jgi:hypothetical protein